MLGPINHLLNRKSPSKFSRKTKMSNKSNKTLHFSIWQFSLFYINSHLSCRRARSKHPAYHSGQDFPNISPTVCRNTSIFEILSTSPHQGVLKIIIMMMTMSHSLCISFDFSLVTPNPKLKYCLTL